MQPKIVHTDSAPIVNVLGDMQRHLLTGADTDGAMTVIRQCIAPGLGVPMHVHAREEELFHVISGEIELVIGGHSHRIGVGATALAPRNVPHAWRNAGPTEAHVLLMVTPAGIEAMFRELSELPPSNPPDFSRVVPICARHGVTFV